MKKTSKNIIAAIAILGLQLSLHNTLLAQNDSINPVYNESVIVVGDYTPVLDGVTEKVNIAPAANDNIEQASMPQFNYSITP
jgi:hypothetical protein